VGFANLTGFAAVDTPYLAPDGRDVVVAMVKVSLDLRGNSAVVATRQRPVRLADEVYDPDADHSSIRMPSDLCVGKRGADVVVVGSARSTEPVAEMLVGVAVGDRIVQLRVHGERTYFRGATGRVAIGDAAPFSQKPIVYERSYGGTTADHARVEARNPVGRGVAHDEGELVDTPAPQIEHPARPITDAGVYEPVGFGAIATSWQPRRGHYGTVDDAHMRDRLPLAPLDYDLRFNNCAHPALQLDAPLAAGTQIRVEGMTLGTPIAFALPELSVRATARFDDAAIDVIDAPFDTLLIDADARVAELTCRVVVALGRGKRRLRELRMESRT